MKICGYDITIVRSARRTVALEIRSDGEILVRAPRRMTNREIEAFVRSREEWLGTHAARAAARRAEMGTVQKYTKDELRQLAEQAVRLIPERVAHYAPLVGVTYGRITIRNQRTRWGSCSAKGNLNFNCLLMCMPLPVIDSVVVHELCHRLEMNHAPRFYREVCRVYPEYDRWHGWLKKHGPAIMARMP